jgi:Tfp pilus assembly protein PilN
MPSFEYVARDAAGAEHTGAMQADSPSAVAALLSQQGLSPVRISECSVDKIDPRALRARQMKFATAMWAVLFAAVVGWAALLGRANSELAGVNRQIDELRQANARLAVLDSRVSAIQHWQVGQSDWLGQLANLSALLPPAQEVYVSNFAASGDKITLDVKARDVKSLARLARDLQAAGGCEPSAQGKESVADRFGYTVKDTLEIPITDQSRRRMGP